MLARHAPMFRVVDLLPRISVNLSVFIQKEFNSVSKGVSWMVFWE
jgi:hypothetical protein